jgi:hypothetical protein
MPTPTNQKLYDSVKESADKLYKKPSAYKSGWIVKTYKSLGGEYEDDNKPKNLKRWFEEEWKDIGNKSYPVYRPTKRINKLTPLTEGEINNKNLKSQIALKQIIKGDYNLPKFEGKGITEYSNPKIVFKKAKEYLGDNVEIKLSDNPKKKYMVLDPHNNKWIHFGQMGYEDFTKHKDPVRRHNYLQRTLFMRGNWKHNKYSSNNLSRHLLWDA